MSGRRCLLANGALPLLALLATCSLCSAGGSDGEILEEDSPWGAVSLRALCRSGWPSPACDELDRVDVGGAGELDDGPEPGKEGGASTERAVLGPGSAGPSHRTPSPPGSQPGAITLPSACTAWRVDITGPTDGEVVVGDVAVTVELAWSGGDGEGVCSARDRGGAGAGGAGDCGACVRLEVSRTRFTFVSCVCIRTHTQPRTGTGTQATGHTSSASLFFYLSSPIW